MPRFNLTAAQRAAFKVVVSKYLQITPGVDPAEVAVRLAEATGPELKAIVQAGLVPVRAEVQATRDAVDTRAAQHKADLDQELSVLDALDAML